MQTFIPIRPASADIIIGGRPAADDDDDDDDDDDEIRWLTAAGN